MSHSPLPPTAANDGYAEFHRRYSQEPLALLRLIHVEGSSYQPVGAIKWVAGDRCSVGMISGGCLEEHVIDLALARPFDQAQSWQEVIDITAEGDRFLGSGLGCRGRLTLSFDLLLPQSVQRQQLIAQQQAQGCTVHIVGGGQDIDPVVSLLAWRDWRAKVYPRTPAERSRLAQQGIPSQLLAEDDLFAQLHLVAGPKILVLMTHHFPTDIALLAQLSEAAIPLDYLGILGSRQRIQALKSDVQDQYGMPLADQLSRVLHGPLGLAGLGKGEKAVALALVSQLQLLFGSREGEGQPKAQQGRAQP